jgi:hypothetical protein
LNFAQQQVADWRLLASKILEAKPEGTMNHRTKSLWLPALATFCGANLSLAMCELFGMQPHIVSIGTVAVRFYWPGLLTLPLFGAAGAHLSKRAYGRMPARIAAGLSPALIMLTALLLILPWGFANHGLRFLQIVSSGLIDWVALPTLALLLSELPFLGQPMALQRPLIPKPVCFGGRLSNHKITQYQIQFLQSFGGTYSFGFADPSPKKNASICFTITS